MCPRPSHTSLSSPGHWAALNPSLWNNHFHPVERWHESNAALHSVISLDRGNILAPWEWGRLRVPGGGQPVQKWQAWACINESHLSLLKWQDWSRNLNELMISVEEISISFKWAVRWISRNLTPFLMTTSRLSYNLPEIVLHLACKRICKRDHKQKLGKHRQFKKKILENP